MAFWNCDEIERFGGNLELFSETQIMEASKFWTSRNVRPSDLKGAYLRLIGNMLYAGVGFTDTEL